MVSPIVPTFALASYSTALRVRSRAPVEDAVAEGSTQTGVKELASRLGKLQLVLERLQRSSRTSTASGASRNAIAIRSSSSLGLAFEPTPTTLSSTEVNTTATSFSPFGPSFSGSSTSLPTIGGTYSGAQGDDTLTFKVNESGTVGADQRLRIDVFDGLSNKIDTLDFQGVAPDTPLTLSNGLTLALSAGDLVKHDTFQVSVSSTVGSSVDPDKPFNGTRNDNPNFEEGLGVTAGSFEVNGVTITVLDTDTINTILSQITASGAGVTATFDSGSETVLLTQKTAGSAHEIVLSNDTSGFLAATKLSGASQVLGADGDVDKTISTVSALSGISTGQFEINGTAIPVDTSVDTLNDVIDRINSSAAGVTASFNPSTNLLTVLSNTASADLALDDDTSGFFSGINISTGTFEARRRPVHQTFANPDDIQQRLREFGSELDGIFKDRFSDVTEDLLEDIRTELRTSIKDSFSEVLDGADRSILQSGFGIGFDFRDAARSVFDLDTRKFTQSASQSFDELNGFLLQDVADGEQDGLIVSLVGALREINSKLVDVLDSGKATGLIVDLTI